MLTTIAAFLGLLAAGMQTASPVHGKLAYIANGEVWTKPLPDGEPRQIRQSGGAQYPQWSASGHWLTFQQERKVVAISENGERREFMADQIAWSPQADELAIVDRDGLAVVRFAGSDPLKRVVMQNSPALQISRPVWSPDGATLAVSVVVTPDPAGRPEFRAGHLWLVNLDGTSAHEVFTPEQRGGVEPVGWSSDGQYILVRVDHDFSASLAADGLPLMAVPALGGPARQLAANVLVPADFVTVSTRKREVLLVNGAGRDTWSNKRLTLSDPGTARLTELSERQTTALAASWSPDGSQIAFVASPDNTGSPQSIAVKGGGDSPRTSVRQRRIRVIGEDGRQHQLTSDSRYRDEYPLWAGDGKSLLFVRMDDQDNASVWSLDVESGAVRKIVERIDGPSSWFGYYGHIDWNARLAWRPD